MYTMFVLNPSHIFVSTAKANANGTHTDWTTPQALPTRERQAVGLVPAAARRAGRHRLHAGDERPAEAGLLDRRRRPDLLERLRRDVAGAAAGVDGNHRADLQNTTFREGIVDTFAVGSQRRRIGVYPLYVAYEDGCAGVSNVWLTASYDGGATWSAPILVNDNAAPVDELQPNLDVDARTARSRRLLRPPARVPRRRRSRRGRRAAGIALDPGQPYGRVELLHQHGVQFYNAEPDADRPQRPAVGAHLGSAAERAAPRLHRWRRRRSSATTSGSTRADV